MQVILRKIHKHRYIILFLVLWALARQQAFITQDYFSLYRNKIIGQAIMFFVLIRQYYQRKKWFELDVFMLFGLVLAMFDMVTRHYLPYVFYEIDNSIVFLCVLLFIYGRLKISFRDNILFIMGYSTFYILLSLKTLQLTMLNFETEIISFIYTIILSIVFSYSLLVTTKVKNFYHCSYCIGVALICIVVLGKRISQSHTDAFFVVQGICSLMMFLSVAYWYEGGEFYTGKISQKKIVNVQFLLNIVAGLLFVLYLFRIDLDDIVLVWGLFWISLAWYVISIVAGLEKFFYVENIADCEELTSNQLDRVERYAQHLKAANYLKKRP